VVSAAVEKQKDTLGGYKQTELGLLPSDWDIAFIEDMLSISTGAKNTQDRIEDGLYPFFVRSQKVERINSFAYDEEAVLTAGDGVGTGKVFHHINGKYDAHQRVYRIFGFSEKIDGRYFFLIFSNNFYDRIMQMTAKSSVDSVRREMISRMMIPLPELKEQKLIAEALSDAETLIESLERLVTKKHQIKSRLLEDLVTGSKRLPKRSEQWVEKRLGSCAILKARIGWQGLTTAEYLETGDYYLITGTEFKNGRIDWSKCHYVEKIRYDQDRNIQVRFNDILVTKDGTIGKVSIIKDMPAEATLNSGVFVIRPLNNSFEADFFYYVLRSSVFEKFLDQLAAGSTINHLYQKDFINFIFKVPPTAAEQNEITEVLREIDNEIDGLESKLDKAKQVKQGMMQDLLTGKVRLI
jgi:type I restriction enzyme S subunit